MKKIPIYAFPVLLTGCAKGITDESTDFDTILPARCYLAPQEEALKPYDNFLRNNEKVVQASGFCEFPSELQEKVWDKILEAEKTGLPPTEPLPAEYQKLISNPEKPVTKINHTREEAYEIYAAHLAHSLWLEKNDIVPWSLLEYSQEQLEELLAPPGFFYRWLDDKEIYASSLLINHSPRESFFIATESVESLIDQQSAVVDLVKELRSYKHGTANQDPIDIITLKGMSEEKIARIGCHSTAFFLVQVAKALNIPGKQVNGYFAGGWHRSTLFEATGQVLAHGDDPYSRLTSNTPTAELMDDYSFWEKEILSQEAGSLKAAHKSMIHNYENGKKYPSYTVLNLYCSGGVQELEHIFMEHEHGPFATSEEIKELEQNILQITSGCTIFPVDNPDNK